VRPPEPPEEEEELDPRLRQALEGLTPAQRQELAMARAAAAGPRRVTHRLAPGTLRKITEAPAIRRTGPLRAVNAGPATEKIARDKAAVRALCVVARSVPGALPPWLCQAAGAP
jgi:hypothetical protein